MLPFCMLRTLHITSFIDLLDIKPLEEKFASIFDLFLLFSILLKLHGKDHTSLKAFKARFSLFEAS